MNHKLRVAALFSGLVMLASACTSGGGATTAPSGGGGGTTALTGNLTVWHSYGSGAGTEAKALKTVTDKIVAANPGLKLTIQDVKFDDLFKKFELEAASGKGPDLFIAPNDSLGKEARAGLFLDITSKLEGKLPNVSQVAIDGSKVDGKFYMVPESLKAVAMYYDKSKVATPPAKTDDLLAAVQSGSIKAGFDAHSSYHSFGWWAAFGGKLMDDKGKCVADTTGVADAYKFFQAIQTAGAKMVKKENEQVFVDTAGHIPADTTITIADPITQKFGDAVKTGFPRPQVPQLDHFWSNFDNALNLVVKKNEDATKAATDACTKMNSENKIS